MAILSIVATQINDSQGNIALKVQVQTDGGTFSAETPFSPDSEDDVFTCKEVLKAVDDVNLILAPAILEKEAIDEIEQDRVDMRTLQDIINTADDDNKKTLSRASYTVSMAVCRAGAAKKGLPLYQYIAELAGTAELLTPLPMFRMIIGGELAENPLPVQELLVVPRGAKSFREAIKMGSETYHHLSLLIKEKFGPNASRPLAGDEGGFSPNISSVDEGLELLTAAIGRAGYSGLMEIGIDVSADDFLSNGSYDVNYKNPPTDPTKHLKPDELLDCYKAVIHAYPVRSFEDPYGNDDWAAWTKLKTTMPDTIQIIGNGLINDDLLLLGKAMDQKACTSTGLQISCHATVTSAIHFCIKARDAKYGLLVCHRSGETDDSFLCDLTVGLGTGQVKTGAPCRSELKTKCDRFIEIEDEIGQCATYAGTKFYDLWGAGGNKVGNAEKEQEVEKEDEEKKVLRGQVDDLTKEVEKRDAFLAGIQTILFNWNEGANGIPRGFIEERVATGDFDNLTVMDAIKEIFRQWDEMDDIAKAPYLKQKKPRVL